MQSEPDDHVSQAGDWDVATFVAWSRSPNPHLRDWATSRLALHEADDEEIRAALLAQLAAPACPARDQALLGLALRGDGRALGPLVRALAEPGADEILIVAAACLAAAELVEPLESLRRRGGGPALEAALERCRRPA